MFAAIEQKGHELFPRVLVGAAVLLGIFGIGSYIQNRGESSTKTERNFLNPTASKDAIATGAQRGQGVSDRRPNGLETVESKEPTSEVDKFGRPAATQPKEQPKTGKIASDGPVYFCGALTKKGKPCSRKVKRNERCWQHVGQPAATVSQTAAMSPG